MSSMKLDFTVLVLNIRFFSLCIVPDSHPWSLFFICNFLSLPRVLHFSETKEKILLGFYPECELTSQVTDMYRYLYP